MKSSKIKQTIIEYKMLEEVKTLIVGFSGGADSVCLLDCLNKIKNEFNIEVVAAHINHNLRGEESKRDEEFVKEFCVDKDIELKVLDVDIKEGAVKAKESIELYARNVRYNFFNDISSNYEKSKIATAHTLSDNAETILYNITRGCSIKGVCGIPPLRENIIRPLIESTREEIEEYCRCNKLTYVIDSTNLEEIYTRNKIRHSVIPNLKEINESFEEALLKLSKNAMENQKYINLQVDKLLNKAYVSNGVYDNSILENENNLLLNNAIVELLRKNSIYNYDKIHITKINNIIKSKMGSLDLTENKRVLIKQGYFRIINTKDKIIKWENRLKDLKYLTKDNKKINIKVVDMAKYEQIVKKDKKVLKNAINYDIISFDTLIRNRRSKDIYSSAERNVTKTIKKLFNEQKILQEKRDNIILIANGSEVLWIEDIGVSKIAKVTKETKKVLIIDCKKV